MQTIKLKAEIRGGKGKGAARQLRAKGQVPAVYYGRGVETKALSVSPKELMEAISGELGKNAVIELELGSESVRTLMTDYQVHPVSRALLHADFLKVEDDREVDVAVPLEFVGKAKGIVMGDKLRQVFREVPVRCLPANIPAKLTYDVTEMQIEDILRAEELPLPDGVTIRLKPAQNLGGVYGSRRGGKQEDGEDDAEAEAEKK